MEENGKVILEAQDAARRYRQKREGDVKAVRGISLRLREGECRGIVGESGCGKSTLLRMFAGLERPDGGQVLYRGKPVFEEMKGNRKQIQMVFQNSMDAVNPYADAGEIIGEPLRNFFSMSRAQRRERAGELMEQVGLSAEDLGKYPSQFSGGQLQRVCIARALAAEPEVLLLDEPLSSLDVSVQAQIMELFSKIRREKKISELLVSHDLEAVYYLSDSISVLYGGRVMEEIDKISLFDRLSHPYTKRLLSACLGEEESGEAWASSDQEIGGDGCPYANQCPDCRERCRRETPDMREPEKGHRIWCWKEE